MQQQRRQPQRSHTPTQPTVVAHPAPLHALRTGFAGPLQLCDAESEKGGVFASCRPHRFALGLRFGPSLCSLGALLAAPLAARARCSVSALPARLSLSLLSLSFPCPSQSLRVIGRGCAPSIVIKVLRQVGGRKAATTDRQSVSDGASPLTSVSAAHSAKLRARQGYEASGRCAAPPPPYVLVRLLVDDALQGHVGPSCTSKQHALAGGVPLLLSLPQTPAAQACSVGHVAHFAARTRVAVPLVAALAAQD